jgi:8-oxo-dGTP pyrophosphatase MutT (NUDIX family)
MTLLRTEKIEQVDLRFVQRNWPFADERREEIDARWTARVASNPTLWNGRVLISQDVKLENGRLSAVLSETDYASFVVWRDLDWPDKSIFNIFGMGVIISSDGALLFGEMAQNTVNPGKIYPPGGSLEPRDVKMDGSVDIDHSIAEEVLEETGIDVRLCERGLRHAVFDGQRIAVVQSYALAKTFTEIEQNFAAHVANIDHHELTRLVPLWVRRDIVGAMPEWAKACAKLYL